VRIAVTAVGTNLESSMDPRFGRARYIVIIDETGEVIDVVDNSVNVNAMQGAGIQAAKLLSDRKVEVLMTGHCGPNAFKTLKAAGINVVVDQSGTVRQAFDRLTRNEVTFADQPNAEAHW
jgi:predicted Fe-Mo cluster-binding NifX family protein